VPIVVATRSGRAVETHATDIGSAVPVSSGFAVCCTEGVAGSHVPEALVDRARRSGRTAVETTARSAEFLAGVYAERTNRWLAARAHRDPLAVLQMRLGGDPYPTYAQMRRRGKLLPTRVAGWVTTDYEISRDVLRSRRFGVRPEGDDSTNPLFDVSMLERNPPTHTRLRRAAAPAFSATRIAGYGALVRTVADELLDDLVARGSRGEPVDLVTGFCRPLPVAVIGRLIGVPEHENAELTRYGEGLISALDGIRSLRQAAGLATARDAIRDSLNRLIALREREPGEDLISDLISAREQGRLEPEEVAHLCGLLLIAGFETSVHLIGTCVVHLQRWGQWQLLAEDPGLAAATAEEALRFDPPVQQAWRTSFDDTEIAGAPIRRGQLVFTLIGATGRDPAVFERPDIFDITRHRTADHLAFSSGAHYCIGAPLARLEAVEALSALVRQLPGLRLAGAPTMRRTAAVRGPVRIPVTLAAQPVRAGRLG